mgnify:CR=1 FL=1
MGRAIEEEPLLVEGSREGGLRGTAKFGQLERLLCSVRGCLPLVVHGLDRRGEGGRRAEELTCEDPPGRGRY